jgi:protein-tyrosine phosphatase
VRSHGWRGLVHRLISRLYGPPAGITWLTWIGEERLAVGSVPTPQSLKRLIDSGITHVVNCRARPQTWLSQDLALERLVFGKAQVVHAPMWDNGRPQHPALWLAAAQFAATTLDQEATARVLVHCQQGRRRSVMVAYAILRLRGRTPDQAADLILRHRIEAELVPVYQASVEQALAQP